MLKIIHFFSNKKYQNMGKPVPIKKLLPEWYKDSETNYVVGNNEAPGLKKCMPFLDAMISGYAIVFPVDVFVSRSQDGKLNIRWNSPEVFNNLITERDSWLGEKMPRPEGHYNNHLAFTGFWGWKVPKGWSVLVTHPLNRHDLPFTITSGIIDSDEFYTSGNIPFFIKENFVGVIPAGTPIAQLIPIKRSNWQMTDNDPGLRHIEKLQGEVVRNPNKGYKKIFWHRKSYN